MKMTRYFVPTYLPSIKDNRVYLLQTWIIKKEERTKRGVYDDEYLLEHKKNE